MKGTYLAGVVGAALSASMALAADIDATKSAAAPSAPPSALIAWPEPNFDVLGAGFDYSLGARFMSDYVVRGISHSGGHPAGNVYGDLRYGWFYSGVSVTNVDLPMSPAAEIDVYGGIRPTWGPLTLDVGALFYGHPGSRQQWWLASTPPFVATFQFSPKAGPTTAFDPSAFEVYAKPSWALNEYLTLGGAFGYDPNWANQGAPAAYYEANVKFTAPGTGFSVSGAFGHQYLGYKPAQPYGFSYIDPDPVAILTGTKGIKGFKLASYNTWNVGATYKWKMVTLEVRYHDSNLSRAACFLNIPDPAGNLLAAVTGQGSSPWCGARVVGSIAIAFDSSTFR